MILLDSNVFSEGWRLRPDNNVLTWLDAQPAEDLYLCTPVLAELHYGSQLLPIGVRRTKLEQAISELMNAFAERILSFDAAAALEYGKFVARRDSRGRSTGAMDGLIAGIALSRGALIATRDISGFDDSEITLIDPFNPASDRG